MVKTKKLGKKITYELNEAYQKTLNWFFSYPNNEIGLSDLAETVNISKKTANLVVTKLENEGFLKKEVIGRIWRISCNQTHIYNYSRKIAYNLRKIYESGLIEEVHKAIESPKSIILFGSYRKGDDTEESDIDIAVEIIGDDEPKIINLGVLEEMGYRSNVPVNLYVFSRKKVDINLFSNIVNGIVLEGFLEAKP
ncbi:MAG: nucleotidyltransferase domain-containing protein [Candidatus Aenigmarchaeota archaeon]|nr:nucleotidyltransferase domain-containing protein [Candidatus Aenigmarchaeota archaeon]